MSGDSNGQTTRRVRAKVPSVLLALTGIAVVAIQTYVFVSFADFLDIYQPFALYNGMAMASGSVSCLTGILCLCCTASKRSSSSLTFSVLTAVLAAIASAGSAALTAMESSRIHSKNEEHPCSTQPGNSPTLEAINCGLWFDLELTVAALSSVSFILSLTLIILISIALAKSKKEIKGSNHQHSGVMVQEMEHIPSSQPVVVMPVIVEEEVDKEPEIEPEIEPEPEPEPEMNTIAGRQPYIEQLKMLSREELERRLGEHMQQQFLEELRSELNRRNLIPINGRQTSINRSNSSSVKSGKVSVVPVAPRPDYYQEESL